MRALGLKISHELACVALVSGTSAACSFGFGSGESQEAGKKKFTHREHTVRMPTADDNLPSTHPDKQSLTTKERTVAKKYILKPTSFPPECVSGYAGCAQTYWAVGFIDIYILDNCKIESNFEHEGDILPLRRGSLRTLTLDANSKIRILHFKFYICQNNTEAHPKETLRRRVSFCRGSHIWSSILLWGGVSQP